jgi:hypothetical protein
VFNKAGDSFEEVKRNVSKAWPQLKSMENFGEMLFERGRKRRTVNLFYEKGANVSKLHEYIVNEVVLVLRKSPSVKIIHIAKSGEMSNSDIETDLINFEIETGLKRKYDDLKKRLDTIITTSTRNGVIVVPNEGVKKTYEKLASEFAQGRVMVVTFGEFEDAQDA